MNAIKNLIRGNELFKNYHYADYEDEIKELIKHGQKPDILFISCCDSRITPDLMLGSKPGDLFILRNIGNFVPPYDNDLSYHGSASAIEYAVSVLNVKHIIVCGHSYCGACKSAFEEIPNTQNYKNIKKWLKLADEAKKITLRDTYKTEFDMAQAMEKNSVLCQKKNLHTYPAIKEKLLKNEIQLHAWYIHLEGAKIEYYNNEINKYEDISLYQDNIFS